MRNYTIEYQVPFGGRDVFYCSAQNFVEAMEQLFYVCPVAKIVDFEEN